MKSMQTIEGTRRDYHQDAEKNTVHRSSLLAPSLPGTRVDVSFVNHFRLKRGHDNVACRLTAVGPDGQKIESRTLQVTEPRVYALELSALTDEPVANYIIEFFSPTNLFIPFPAAVINHRNDRFLNAVHSYNRVLNDVFENDAVNATPVREASIDVRVDEDTDTFGIFTAGPNHCQGTVDVSVRSPDGHLQADVPVDMQRLSNRILSLHELFGDKVTDRGGVLTFKQPDQPMFYGRMLAGLHYRPDGAISANHSFYDCSEVEEYWDDGRPSSRVFPLFPGFNARVRLYPIFSPCELHSAIDLVDAEGTVVKTVECEPLTCPSDDHLDVSVAQVIGDHGLEQVTGFQYRAWPSEGGTPRRINHQIVYEDDQGRSPLAASAAISLRNPNMFNPPGKTGLTWGQCAASEDLDTWLGLTLDTADGERVPVNLKLYSEDGEVLNRQFEMVAGTAQAFNPRDLVPDCVAESGNRPHYLWYWATCPRPDLSAYTVIRNRVSGHCSGDHSF